MKEKKKVYVVTCFDGDKAFVNAVFNSLRRAQLRLLDLEQEEICKYNGKPEADTLKIEEKFDYSKYFEYAIGKAKFDYSRCTEYSIGESIIKHWKNASLISNNDGNICYRIEEVTVK